MLDAGPEIFVAVMDAPGVAAMVLGALLLLPPIVVVLFSAPWRRTRRRA